MFNKIRCTVYTAFLIVLVAMSGVAQTTNVIDGTLSQRAWVVNYHPTGVTTNALTIKATATSDAQRILMFAVTCSSACLITIERGGTAASATCAAVVGAQESSSYTYLAQACTASNAGAGTEIGHGRLFAAGVFPFTGQAMRLSGKSTEQVTIRVTQDSSGTVDYWVLGEFVP